MNFLAAVVWMAAQVLTVINLSCGDRAAIACSRGVAGGSGAPSKV